MVITPLIANNYLIKTMTKDHSKDGFVQVQLNMNCECYVPGVDSDGMLSFHKAYPAGDSFIDFKVWVPSEVTKSKGALTEYVRQQQESDCAEFVGLTDVNIWIDDPDHEDGGKFAFSFR